MRIYYLDWREYWTSIIIVFSEQSSDSKQSQRLGPACDGVRTLKLSQRKVSFYNYIFEVLVVLLTKWCVAAP